MMGSMGMFFFYVTRGRRDFIPPHLFGESVSRDGDELVTRQTLSAIGVARPANKTFKKVTQLAACNTLASKTRSRLAKSCSARLERLKLIAYRIYTIATALPLLAQVITEVPKL